MGDNNYPTYESKLAFGAFWSADEALKSAESPVARRKAVSAKRAAAKRIRELGGIPPSK